ncbi:hypothetical protein QFC21_003181 [Naganishia friedmannii]|uniref:Uncharacterized protein n=1 Tax=Naganishia friedmannii TaxID=89922 RepID=A0ACC2VRU3_9TREE|nr:hypothetical protein QFC21_003181 [Naganishia friedmannii]
MTKNGGGMPTWLLLLLLTHLVSSVIAFPVKYPLPTAICEDEDSACDWPLCESPSAETLSATATLYTSISATSSSSTPSVTTSLAVRHATYLSSASASSTSAPSLSAAPTPVIRQTAEATHSDGRLTRTYDDNQQQQHQTINQHREGSSQNPSADGFIGLDDKKDNATFPTHTSSRLFGKARFVRDDFDLESFEEQRPFASGSRFGTRRYREALVANPKVRRVKEYVFRPHPRYAVDFGLSEVPVNWSPSDDIIAADEQAKAAAQKLDEMTSATKNFRSAETKFKTETAKAKAARDADDAATQRKQQQWIDNDQLERKRQMDYAALVEQQKTEREALIQSLQHDNDVAESQRQQNYDEAENRRQQEHEAALAKADAATAKAVQAVAKADEAAESSNQAQAAADEEKEKYQHLVKVGNILLEQARREYRRASMLAPIVLCFLVVALSVLGLVVFVYGRLKPVKPRSRGDKQLFRGPSQPPDDSPPPPDHPSPPTNDYIPLEDDVTPQADETAPRLEDSAPSPPNGDAKPPPQNGASPYREKDAAPSDDLTPSTGCREQQRQEEAAQPDINRSAQANSHRFVSVLRRNARQRHDRTSAAARFSASLKKTHSVSNEPAAPCENPVPFVLVNNSESGSVSSAKSSDDSLSVNPESVIEVESRPAPALVCAGVQTDLDIAHESKDDGRTDILEPTGAGNSVETVAVSVPPACSIGVQTAEVEEYAVSVQPQESPQASSVARRGGQVKALMSRDEDEGAADDEPTSLCDAPAPEGSVGPVAASIPATCLAPVQTQQDGTFASKDDEQRSLVQEGQMASTANVPALENPVESLPTSSTTKCFAPVLDDEVQTCTAEEKLTDDAFAPQSSVESVPAAIPATSVVSKQTDKNDTSVSQDVQPSTVAEEYTMIKTHAPVLESSTGLISTPSTATVSASVFEDQEHRTTDEDTTLVDNAPDPQSSVEAVPASDPTTRSVPVQTVEEDTRWSGDDEQPFNDVEEGKMTMWDAPALESSVELMPTSSTATCPVAVQKEEVNASEAAGEGQASTSNNSASTCTFSPTDVQLAVLNEETTPETNTGIDVQDISRSIIAGLNDVELSVDSLRSDVPSTSDAKARPSMLEIEPVPTNEHASVSDDISPTPAAAVPKAQNLARAFVNIEVRSTRAKSLTPAGKSSSAFKALPSPKASSSLTGFGVTRSFFSGSRDALEKPVGASTSSPFASSAIAFGLAPRVTATLSESRSAFGLGKEIDSSDSSEPSATATLASSPSAFGTRSVVNGSQPSLPTIAPASVTPSAFKTLARVESSRKPLQPSITKCSRRLDSSRWSEPGLSTNVKELADTAHPPAPVTKGKKVLVPATIVQLVSRPARPQSPSTLVVPSGSPDAIIPEPARRLETSRWADSASKTTDTNGTANAIRSARKPQEEKVNLPALVTPISSVHTSVNSVATGANTRPVNANRVSQAGPRVSYATTASQSLPETHNQGSIPSTGQNGQQAAKLPGKPGDAKLPKIDADAPPRVHNPKYYFEDGGKKPHRSKRGSGINKKALRAEEARLRLEAELAGNGHVGSGGAGNEDVGLESDESSEDEA